MTAADALGLLERLVAAELVELSKMVPRIVQYGQKARSGVDEAYRDALALSLHAFYTATEKVLERIAREVDGALPRGRPAVNRANRRPRATVSAAWRDHRRS